MTYTADHFRNRLTIASLLIAIGVLAISTRMFQLSVFRSEEIARIVRQQDRYWDVPLKTAQDQLEKVIKNIENMTLGEIRSSILQAKEFLEHLQAEQRENLRALNELRRRLAEESHQVSSLERQRRTLESLKEQDTEVLSYLLARDAKKEKWSSFLLGALVSFPVGVASSLLATLLFSYLSGRKTTSKNPKSGVDPIGTRRDTQQEPKG